MSEYASTLLGVALHAQERLLVALDQMVAQGTIDEWDWGYSEGQADAFKEVIEWITGRRDEAGQDEIIRTMKERG